MTSGTAVRVVCVTYHPGPELADFAESLRAATASPTELVIVDNGADHTVADDVARRHGARLVIPGRNLGYGAAANLGARGAGQPWLVVVNPDIVWHEGALDLLVEAGERAGLDEQIEGSFVPHDVGVDHDEPRLTGASGAHVGSGPVAEVAPGDHEPGAVTSRDVVRDCVVRAVVDDHQLGRRHRRGTERLGEVLQLGAGVIGHAHHADGRA